MTNDVKTEVETPVVEPNAEDAASQAQTEPSAETTPGNLPPSVAEEQSPAGPAVDPVKPEVIVKHHMRTRYTYEIFHKGADRLPAFTVSFIESDPERVALKFWEALGANVAINKLDLYTPRIKSIEVLD